MEIRATIARRPACHYPVAMTGEAVSEPTTGGDGRALGTVLAKIGKAGLPGMTILHGHPATDARIAAIGRLADPHPDRPFLSAADWAALQIICVR